MVGVGGSIQNRTGAWMKDVEVRIMELVKQGKIDLETLSARPEFSAILLRVMTRISLISIHTITSITP